MRHHRDIRDDGQPCEGTDAVLNDMNALKVSFVLFYFYLLMIGLHGVTIFSFNSFFDTLLGCSFVETGPACHRIHVARFFMDL